MATPAEMEQWLMVDETARAMLKRVLERRQPSLAPMPPLHRVALHGGHVLEVAGPSGCGKSEVLMQAAVTCILPKEWEGLRLGGSEKPAMYIDLDCHFDMQRLVHIIKCRIEDCLAVQEATRTAETQWRIQREVDPTDYLIALSLKRFYLKRCFNSFEFLVTLKTIRPQLKEVEKEHGSTAQLLLVDSIGAFYWLDRAVRSTANDAGRKTLSLHTVSEVIVRELGELTQTYPSMLIMATKTIIHADSGKEHLGPRMPDQSGTKNKSSDRNQVFEERNFAAGSRTVKSSEWKGRSLHREYMPAVWQAFITHRLLLQGPFYSECSGKEPFFTAEWDLSSSGHVDRFVIHDGSIKLTS